MNSVKKRLVCIACALVLCVSVLAFPAEASKKVPEDYMVRVGMYFKSPSTDTRWFSSFVRSDGKGFKIGSSDGRHFSELLEIDEKDLVILPQVNANLDISSESKKCRKKNGNIGSYSIKLGFYRTFRDAKKAAGSFGNGFVAVTDSGFEARKGGYNSEAEAKKAAGRNTVCIPDSRNITVVSADSADILLMYERTDRPFAIKSTNYTVKLPMYHRTGSIYNYTYPGFFEYRSEDCLLNMVNCVDIETYTRCVMANEIGVGFSEETRKAFSVLARTVAFSTKHKALGFDVCNSSCCQVYHGTFRMGEENNRIADSTRGQIVTYKDEPIAVLYHGSNGGKSCSSVAAWGGEEVPYLTSVTLKSHKDVEEDVWNLRFTQREFAEYIKSRPKFSDMPGNNISVSINSKDPYGSDYITSVSVRDGKGNTVTVENSEAIRRAMGFSSANFDINYKTPVVAMTSNGIKTIMADGIITEDGIKKFDGFEKAYFTKSGKKIMPTQVEINGRGSGHGVGFSSAGSETLALSGYSYEYILKFFFSGTEIKNIYD